MERRLAKTSLGGFRGRSVQSQKGVQKLCPVCVAAVEEM